jgi:probable O-glycosylation ligase (exosortase A-associated)
MFAWGTVKVMLILYMPFILSVMACVTSLERLKKTVLILISVMVYVAIYSLTHHGMGSGNYFKDENDLCLYVNMYLPFCYFLMLHEQRRMMKAFYAFALATGLFAVVISFSRGGFVGLVAMGFVVWVISRKKVVCLILICLIGLSVYYFAGDRYWKEMDTIENINEGTAKARTESWKAGWRMFLDNPLGVGGGNFPARFPEYQSDYFKRGMWGRAAHSLWFTLIPELGIAGIFIYLSLLYYNVKDIFIIKKLRKESAGDRDSEYVYYLSLAFLASFAGYFASGTFLSVLYYPHYWYLTAILVATTRIAKNLASHEFEMNSRTLVR